MDFISNIQIDAASSNDSHDRVQFESWESLFPRDVHFVKDQFPCRGSVPKSIMNNLENVELDDDDENF